MSTIKARIYGSINAVGAEQKFEIVYALPEVGETIDDFSKVANVRAAHMDPENRYNDDRMDRYGFYVVECVDEYGDPYEKLMAVDEMEA